MAKRRALQMELLKLYYGVPPGEATSPLGEIVIKRLCQRGRAFPSLPRTTSTAPTTLRGALAKTDAVAGASSAQEAEPAGAQVAASGGARATTRRQ